MLPSLLTILILTILTVTTHPSVIHDETERISAYNQRQYTWPPKEHEYHPNTPGWRKIFQRRYRQIEKMKVESSNEKLGVYLSSIHAGLMCPNYTENGWGLTRAPEGIVDELRYSLHHGLTSGEATPEETEIISTDDPHQDAPLFIHQPELNEAVLHQLQPLVEAWANTSLVPNNAYGLRVYQNSSVLHMHVDNLHTHIISVILHVDHDPNGDPWPIVIEDFQGNLNEVNLESGDMLFYESSKCMHGRPRKYNGRGYSSLFLHYYPVDWDGDALHDEAHFRIPPGWKGEEVVKDKGGDGHVEQLIHVEGAVVEPECEDAWCALETSKKWRGPAERVGEVMTVGGVVTTLEVPSDLDFEYEEEEGDENGETADEL